MSTSIFTLYVTGHSHRTSLAIENLTCLLEEVLQNEYDLKIIDVLDNPKIAEEQLILATPTLVRSFPFPTVRLVGDLSDRDGLLCALGWSGPSSHFG